MQNLWPFNSSRLPNYSNLDTEPVSNTESSEKDPVETQCHHGRPPPIYTQIALIVLAAVCISETLALVLQHYRWTSELKPLIKSPVPSVLREIRSFEDEPSLHGLRNKADVEAAWEHLNLPVAGFVYLPHPIEYGLLPNTHVIKGAENVYSVSAYHQLHCLKIMHLTFVELWNLETDDERMTLEHVEHCIAYIKQGVMCAGDTALEGPDVGGGTLQGWGIKHECRTWGGENGLVEKIDVLNDQMIKQQEACAAAGRC